MHQLNYSKKWSCSVTTVSAVSNRFCLSCCMKKAQMTHVFHKLPPCFIPTHLRIKLANIRVQNNIFWPIPTNIPDILLKFKYMYHTIILKHLQRMKKSAVTINILYFQNFGIIAVSKLIRIILISRFNIGFYTLNLI